MSRKRVLEIGAAMALLLTVVAAGGFWLHRWHLNRALVRAVWNTRPALVRELLDRGADPNARGTAAQSFSERVQILFRPAAHNPWNQTVLLYTASGNPSGATAKVLLQGGADPNAVDRDGQTALMKAAAAGNPDIVQILIRFGADVNVQNTAGYTALMNAVQAEHEDIVEELLRAGARTDLRQRSGETALSLARKALARTAQQAPVQHWEEVVQRRHKRCAAIIRRLEAAAAPKDGSSPPVRWQRRRSHGRSWRQDGRAGAA